MIITLLKCNTFTKLALPSKLDSVALKIVYVRFPLHYSLMAPNPMALKKGSGETQIKSGTTRR